MRVELPPLSAEDLQQSDEELGGWLLWTWVGHHAQRKGFALNAIPSELATSLVEETAKMDSESVANAPLESAFRKACKGDMAAAGRMLRTYLHSNAVAMVNAKYAERDRRRQNGTRKPRRPEVDAWIRRKLETNPTARSSALWADAPEWITDQLGKDRFAKRVTEARKQNRVASK